MSSLCGADALIRHGIDAPAGAVGERVDALLLGAENPLCYI